MANHHSQLLEGLLQREISVLRSVPEAAASVRPLGDSTWSPKEELGHLIDSATNNHVRFVRALIEPEFHGPGYAQSDWVRVHEYQKMSWLVIVDFWYQYNSFLVNLLDRMAEVKLETACFVGADNPVSLRFLVEDYVLHMQHHVDHLLGREHVTPYPATPSV
jgi:hypothetical protein